MVFRINMNSQKFGGNRSSFHKVRLAEPIFKVGLNNFLFAITYMQLFTNKFKRGLITII